MSKSNLYQNDVVTNDSPLELQRAGDIGHSNDPESSNDVVYVYEEEKVKKHSTLGKPNNQGETESVQNVQVTKSSPSKRSLSRPNSKDSNNYDIIEGAVDESDDETSQVSREKRRDEKILTGKPNFSLCSYVPSPTSLGFFLIGFLMAFLIAGVLRPNIFPTAEGKLSY